MAYSPVTTVKKFVDGFKEGVNPAIAVPDPMDGGNGTPDDLIDYASQDRIDASRSMDAGLGQDGESEAEPIRALNGALDFLGEVAQDAFDFATEHFERENGEGQRWDTPADRGVVLRTFDCPARTMRTTRFTIVAPEQILRRSTERHSIRLVNLGPEVVSISIETRVGSGAQPNTFSVPISKLDGSGPYMPVDLPIQDEVWATTATGVASILEVIDFFGYPE